MGSGPVKVHCDMGAGGVTRVGHNYNHQQTVSSCPEPGCAVYSVMYDINSRQLEALILLSDQCEQYIKYDCKAAPLNQNNESNAWWVDRNDELHFYWSGNGEREEEMDYQGYCYCHNRDNCLSQVVLIENTGARSDSILLRI